MKSNATIVKLARMYREVNKLSELIADMKDRLDLGKFADDEGSYDHGRLSMAEELEYTFRRVMEDIDV